MRTREFGIDIEAEVRWASLVQNPVLIGIAAALAVARSGREAPFSVAVTLADIAENGGYSPEEVTAALVSHERVLDSEDGLDGGLSGGDSALVGPAPQPKPVLMAA